MNADLLGKKLVASVVRVEAYGVYLEYGQQVIVVLIPDISGDRIPDLKEKYTVGERVAVRILSYVDDLKVFKGTIKDA